MSNQFSIVVKDVFHLPNQGCVVAVERNNVSIQLKPKQWLYLPVSAVKMEQIQLKSVMVKELVALVIDEQFSSKIKIGTKLFLNQGIPS